MDRFFTQEFCDRCGGSLEDGRIMSMYNNDCICMKCKEAERRRADYNDAVKADHDAIKAGNYNFAGIGLKPERETYKAMKDRHQAEVNALPLAFAFSKDRYIEKLAEWNITEAEAEAGAILSIGAGGFIRATDEELVKSTFERIHDETEAAIAADTTGDGFIYEMFLYELNNHEYSYTGDVDETLDALNITWEEMADNRALLNGLNKALKEIGRGRDPFDE